MNQTIRRSFQVAVSCRKKAHESLPTMNRRQFTLVIWNTSSPDGLNTETSTKSLGIPVSGWQLAETALSGFAAKETTQISAAQIPCQSGLSRAGG